MAVQQNALNRANQLAEAKRKVAAMQAEIDRMEKEYASTQTNHEQQPPLGATHQYEIYNIQNSNTLQGNYVPPSAGTFNPNSPLSTALQHTPWPLGYKPTQLLGHYEPTDEAEEKKDSPKEQEATLFHMANYTSQG